MQSSTPSTQRPHATSTPRAGGPPDGAIGASTTTATSANAPGAASTSPPPVAAGAGGAEAPSAEEDRLFETIRREGQQFYEYERQYQEVLMTLEGDDVMEAFRAEFEGLHNSFSHSHEGETRLLRKCTDLQIDIAACVEKAVAAAELTAGDQQTIVHLKEEIERTSRRLIEAREREAQLKESVRAVKEAVAEQQAKSREPVEAPAQEAALQSLLHLHETVQREEERVAQTLRAQMLDVSATEGRLQMIKDRNFANEAELRSIREQIASKQTEAQDILNHKAAKESQLYAIRQTMTRRTMYMTERQRTLDALKDDHERNGQELLQSKQEEVALAEEYQQLSRQLQNINSALQGCNEENDTWQRRVQEKTAELQVKQDAVKSAHRQYLKSQKLLESLHLRNTVTEQERVELQASLEKIKSDVSLKEAELTEARRLLDADEQALASVKRELHLLHQAYAGESQQREQQAALLGEKRSQLHHSERELAAFEYHNEQTRLDIYKEMQEARRYEEESKRNAFTCAHLLSDVYNKEQELVQCEEQIAEIESRIKQQEMLLDTMVVDRNNYTNHYDQLRHQFLELQHNFSLLLDRIKSVKTAVRHQEVEIEAEETRARTLQMQQKELSARVVQYQRSIGKKQRSVSIFTNEVRQLHEVLLGATEESTRQQRRCNEVIQERDNLDRQRNTRSAELVKLYEQLHTQQSLLLAGENAYRTQAQRLEHLEYQTTLFQGQLEKMRAFVQRVPELQVMVNNAGRDLQRERVKARALLDESKRPINVHPHQQLISSEPETYDLLRRVQHLQRVLVLRQRELEQRDAAITEAEQTYMQAKATIAHQPGPEIAAQLSTYQQHLVKKRHQMKKMQDTLGFFQEQTDQLKARHDVLRERLGEMAEEYATTRKQQERDAAAAAAFKASASQRKDEEGIGRHGHGELLVYHGYTAPPRETSPVLHSIGETTPVAAAGAPRTDSPT